MKIKEVTIEHYLSLKKVTLLFDGFTVLIGKNGSGKTSVMEALYRFFTDFSATGGGVPSGLSEYCWFRRDLSRPIRISVELELTNEEFEKIFQQFPKTIQLALKEQLGEKVFSLKISRLIVSPQIGWKTEYLNFGEIQLVKEEKEQVDRNIL